MRTLRNRILIIFGLALVSAWSLLPRSIPDPSDSSREMKVDAINFGLDLAGGMHLAVEIDDPDGSLTDEARADAVDRILTTLRNRIDEFGVREPTIQRVGPDRIIVELAGIDDPERAMAIVERTAFLEFKLVRDDDNFRDALPRFDRAIVAELGADAFAPVPVVDEGPSLDALLGDVAGDTADIAGDTLLDAGVADEATDQDEPERRPLTGLLLESGLPGMFLVAEQDKPTVERYLALDTVKALIPRATDMAWGVRPTAVGGASYRELRTRVRHRAIRTSIHRMYRSRRHGRELEFSSARPAATSVGTWRLF